MFFSLPVSVKNSHPLGYWLTPVLVDSFSKQVGEKGVFCYGKLGLRAPSSEEEAVFLKNLSFLGINCEITTDQNFKNDLFANALLACGSDNVSTLTQECFCCPCGVFAIPVSVIKYAKQKTFERTNEKPICRVCGNEAKIASVETLIYKVKPKITSKSIEIYPKWYQKEVDELVDQICEQGVPISKNRLTGFKFGDWNMDVEFLWSFLPLVLSGKGSERLRMVVTNHVLRPALTAYLLCSELIPGFSADLVISPMIVHPGKMVKWNLDRMKTLGYDGDLLRLALLSSLGWNKKESNLNDSVATVEHRRFNLLKMAIVYAEQKPHDISQAMINLSRQSLVEGLSNVFNPESFDYSTLRGLFQ